MLDDDTIDFSDGAMFAAPKPRPPALAPLAPKPAPAIRPPAPDGVMVPRCPQCGFAYGTAFHSRMIWRGGRQNEVRFCSEACGANYQMGCEG